MNKIRRFICGVVMGAIVTASLISVVYAWQPEKKDTSWEFNACPVEGPLPTSMVQPGATVMMRHYGAGETIKWATDFFVNPERARNREVLYVYGANDVVNNFGLIASQASKTPVKWATFNAHTPKPLGYKTPSDITWKDVISARAVTISKTESAWAQNRAKSVFGSMLSHCAETPETPAFVAINQQLPKSYKVLGRFIAERNAWEPTKK